MYEKLLAALQRENADISACNILSCSPERQSTWGCKEYTVGNAAQILSLLYSDTLYPASAMPKLYRRGCWQELRFPVGKICEDAFTTYLLVHRAERIVQIPEALYCYRIRPNSIMTSSFRPARMDEEEAWRANYEFVRAHYPRLGKLAFDFYLQKVNILIHAIPRAQRQEFSAEFEFLQGILRKNLGYIAFGSGMSLKKRARLLLDYINL